MGFGSQQPAYRAHLREISLGVFGLVGGCGYAQNRRAVWSSSTCSIQQEFWTPYPVAALAKSERWYTSDWLPADLGCNWRAKTWIPINYMIFHGLRNYGYTDLAGLVADRTYRLVKESGDCEYYDAETGQGCGLDPFWGWSLLGHFMRYEAASQLDITGLEEG